MKALAAIFVASFVVFAACKQGGLKSTCGVVNGISGLALSVWVIFA